MVVAELLTRKIHSWWLCIRARISRAVIFPYATFIATFVAVRGIPPLMPAITATVAGLLIALGIYISNDVADIKTDIANLVNRPIARGEVLERDALTLTAILYTAGLMLSLTINLTTFILCLIGVILGIS
ncbi:MAG: UbiA family prenyltransferase, partial [Candidatus Bathyarchaeia archaeon]